MSQLTDTLAANDRFVDGFMSDLTSVSTQLAADRGNLAKALAALARAVGTVRTFVHDNKSMVQKDVRALSRLLGVTARHKDDLNTLARIGALGLDNLTIAYDNKIEVHRVAASRPAPTAPTSATCSATSSSTPGSSPGDHGRDSTCELLRTIVKPFSDQIGADPSQNQSQPAQLKLGGTAPSTTLDGPARLVEGGERAMIRSRQLSASRPIAAVVLLAGHRPARVRLQVRRRLRPAAAGQQGRLRRRLRGHRRLRRRAQRGAPHRRVRQRRARRAGQRGRAGRLARPGEVPGAQGHRPAGERRGRRTPDQPAGGEVHRPGRARTGYGEHEAALRRRLHPAVPHQPQPGGRGGPRRPVDAARRRWRRSAQDDQPRAEQHDERSPGPGPAPAGQPRPDDRRARQAEGRHHRRDGVDRPAVDRPWSRRRTSSARPSTAWAPR